MVGDQVWQDDAAGVWLPTHRRGLGYVFQEASLFPHLSVHDNIHYGLRRTPVARQRVALVSGKHGGRFDEMVHICELLPDIMPEARARLDKAMAGIEQAFDANRLAHLLDKRDTLLALASTGDKLTEGATGAA